MSTSTSQHQRGMCKHIHQHCTPLFVTSPNSLPLLSGCCVCVCVVVVVVALIVLVLYVSVIPLTAIQAQQDQVGE